MEGKGTWEGGAVQFCTTGLNSLQSSVGPGGAGKGAGFWLALVSPSQSAAQGLTPPALPVLTTAVH